MHRCGIVKTIESEVTRGKHLCKHDDLTGVHREVFGYVKDGMEYVNLVALYRTPFQDGCRVKAVESLSYFVHGGSQQLQQFVAFNYIRLSKLRVTISLIFLSS